MGAKARPTTEERQIISETARSLGLPYRVVLGRLQAGVAAGRLDRLVSERQLLYRRAMKGDVTALIEFGRRYLGQADQG
jgi:hypothetical protein